MKASRFRRWVLRLLAAVVSLLLLLVMTGVVAVRGSLARLEGTVRVAGLVAPVEITRDAQGVPTITGRDRIDVARALGFVHAQERFFQMDLLRRVAAGELAALFGPAALESDIDQRRHGFRRSAEASIGLMPEPHQQLLRAYAEGVNSGLAALRVRPPEYLLIRAAPEPWEPADSLLVSLAMQLTLQDSQGREDLNFEAMQRALAPGVRAFFAPEGTAFDAPLDGSELSNGALPGPEAVDFRRAEWRTTAATEPAEEEPTLLPGSNAWGVTGKLTPTGAAIVANDMHLDLSVPNVWYRARLRWGVGATAGDGTSEKTEGDLVGVTLPGIPTLIVGSNRRIAWSFTNGTLDTTDLVLLELDPADPSRYRTPGGWTNLVVQSEVIRIAGESNRVVEVPWTIWGPVVTSGDAAARRTFALRWTAHGPGAVNLHLLELEQAQTVAEALEIAPRCAMPVQNLLVGDRDGALGWTLIGRLPRRVGMDGSRPVSWADGAAGWDGWVPAAEYPRWVAAAGEVGWTANNRIMGTPGYLAQGGASHPVRGARAQQIRDDLRALKAPVREQDLLEIYRDDRAVFLAWWHPRLIEVADSASFTNEIARWKEIRDRVVNWEGRASTNSVGYRVVRAFAGFTRGRVLEPLRERYRAVGGRPAGTDSEEEAIRRILTERPAHLLNPRYPDFDALLRSAAEEALRELAKAEPDLRLATWGRRNRLKFEHPIAREVPQLARWLSFPAVELAGDTDMPRVQGPTFGASERLVVSPGHEEQGFFQMPGGQSGHFLSPFYRAGHEDWLEVRPSPLLPGPTQHTLRLVAAP